MNAAFFGLSRGLMDWLPAAPAQRVPAALGHRHCDRHDQRHPDHPLCIPAGRLAAALEFLIGRECIDRSRGAWRGDALPQLWASGAGRTGVDSGAAPSRRTCAGERDAIPDRGWNTAFYRDLRHHVGRRGKSLGLRRWVADRSHEPRRDAADGRLRQRMVRLSVGVSGFPSPEPRRQAGSCAHRRRLGADRRRRVRYLRKGSRH